MTIKEIETFSGMTRANIRFYESEGLLLPARSPNGYRNYSENDLEILKRIRLLRTLDIPLEEIKLLQTGDRELIDALDRHLAELESKQVSLEQSQEICKEMRSDGVQYHTLDAQRYLDAIEDMTNKPVPELEADTVPKVRSPWRRFFARELDLFIYSSLWNIFLTVVMNINIANRKGWTDLLDTFIAFLLMLFIEPALLRFFGTTAGKWILGLRITDSEGRHLSYSEGLSRTWTVFLRGMGLNIPIYNLVRLSQSYQACEEEETLDWEYESILTLQDKKGWRIGAYIGANAALIAVLVLTLFMAAMPKHRGEISVSEFCDNYNRLSEYMDVGSGSTLNENGEWVKPENVSYVFPVEGNGDKPNFIFTEDNGTMTRVAFSTELHDSDAWAPSYQNEMILAILSFARAQKGCSPFSKDIKQVIKQISESPFTDFQYTVEGISITCDVEYSGYMNSASFGALWPEEGTKSDYSFHFMMAKK